MNFDDELILVQQEQEFDDDAVPNDVDTNTTTVFCAVKSITQAEFFNSRQNKINPSFTFVIYSFEYYGERVVEYKNKRYAVTRTYTTNKDRIELHCEEKTGV